MHFCPQGMTPVSYTHLDVYKRQVMKDSRDRAEKEERGLQECSPLLKYKLLNLNHYIIRIRPVSYTHLDVYKRQDIPSYYEELKDYLGKYQSEDADKLTLYVDKLLPLSKLYSCLLYTSFSGKQNRGAFLSLCTGGGGNLGSIPGICGRKLA